MTTTISKLTKKLPKISYIRTATAFFILILLLTAGFAQRSFNESLKEATTNPRFGLAGADTETLRVKIQELKESVDAIAALYSDEGEKRLIKTSFHPLEFLESLPDLEDARRALIADPFIKNWVIYRKRMSNTLNLYRDGLLRYRDALEQLPQTAKNEFYHYGNNAVTRENILANLSALIQNAENLKSNAPDLIFAEPESAPVMSEPALSQTQSKDLEFTKKMIAQMGWRPVMPLAEIPTDCAGNPLSKERDLFYLTRIDNFFAPVSTRQLFFHFTLSLSRGDARLFQPLREAGYDYSWQKDFNYYFCPDSSYHAQILTLYRIRELLLEWRVSHWNADLPELNMAMDNFLKADPIWRETQNKLFGAIRLVLAKNSDEKLRELAGDDTPKLLREILEIHNENSGYFEELIRRGVAMNRNLIKITARLPEPMKMKELFLTRSYPSLYFLPFAKSVWRRDTPLSFVKYYGQTKLYIDYQALLKIYPEKKILDLIALSFGLANR